MRFLNRDGVRLAFQDTEASLRPMLLVHGCGLDHRSLSAVADFFGRSHRIIMVDLRGHGESDAPYQEYAPAAFAEDLRWMSEELSLEGLIVVGHSMGGNVALELAAISPELVSMVIMLDSIMLPSKAMLESLPKDLDKLLASSEYLTAFKHHLSSWCLPTEKRSRA